MNNDIHSEINNILRSVDTCCTFNCVDENIKSQLNKYYDDNSDTLPPDNQIITNQETNSCQIDNKIFNFNYNNDIHGCTFLMNDNITTSSPSTSTSTSTSPPPSTSLPPSTSTSTTTYSGGIVNRLSADGIGIEGPGL